MNRFKHAAPRMLAVGATTAVVLLPASVALAVNASATASPGTTHGPVSFVDSAPQLTLDPSTNVKDGGTITVSATGFPAKSESAYVVECGVVNDGTGDDCDTGNVGFATTKADGSFTFEFKGVHTGPVGKKGVCKAGGKCSISVNTDPFNSTGDPAANNASAQFTFAAAAKSAATTTTAALKGAKIVGKITSGGKGVKGAAAKLELKHGHKWKTVESLKAKSKGKYSSGKLDKGGKYKVVTPAQKVGSASYKASTSKVVKVKA